MIELANSEKEWFLLGRWRAGIGDVNGVRNVTAFDGFQSFF